MPTKMRAMGRRDFVNFLAAIPAGGTVFGNVVLSFAQEEKKVTREMIVQAEEIAGVRFTDAQRQMIIPTLQNYLQNISNPPPNGIRKDHPSKSTTKSRRHQD